MKRNLQIILTAATASFLTFTVMAQENTTLKSDRPDYARDGVNQPQTDRLNGVAKASEIIGMTVNNYQDEELGSVEDLAVDLESGRIVQVILSTDGFAGVGDRLSAVPPGALHHDVTNKVLHLDANKEKLKSAPEFTNEKWTENSDSDHLSAVYSYYGQEDGFTFIQKGDSTDSAANTPSTRNADGMSEKDRRTGESQSMIPASRLGQIQKASTLMGMNVKNQQDENLGELDNMLLDLESGRILAVVVSSGGFLGMGDELSAVPPTALSFNAGRDTLLLDTTKDLLSAAPHFKSDEWPDFNQPMYSDGVYRAYKQEPYFTSDAATDTDKAGRNVRDRNDRTITPFDQGNRPADTDRSAQMGTNRVTDADNAARNARDRNDGTLTPFDQGNSQADTDTTAQIRKGILADKNMSVNAKNVKIITNNGRVTLRGPVQSEEEKRLIGDIANRIAHSGNVDNQLEVIVKTTSN